METLFYSSGKAARELGVSQERIRDLCAAAAIQAEVTAGGQWRITKAVVEGLKRDGLPSLPRPLPGDSPRAGGNARYGHAALLASPSDAVVTAAEQVAITEALLKRRRLERDLEETEDWFRERERDEAERLAAEEKEEHARRTEQVAQREHDEWLRAWEAHALGLIPCGVPPELRLEVQQTTRERLLALDPIPAPPVTRQIVEALVARLLAPWRREKEIEDVLIEARDSILPVAARGAGGELSDWQRRSLRAAGEAIKQLRADAQIEEIRAVGRRAAGGIAAEFEHERACWDMARWIFLPGTTEEDEQARQAVREALAQLPVGASRSEMEAARDAATQPVRDAIARRQAQAQHRANRQSVLDAAGWALPWGFPTEQRPAALKAVAEAVAAIPEGASLAQLKEARDRAIELFRNAHGQRQHREKLIEAALRNIYPYLVRLEESWDYQGATAWSLAQEFQKPIRAALEKEFTGGEAPAQVLKRMQQLVRKELETAPEPAVA